MKIEVAPQRDGRVVITLLPEGEGKPEVSLREEPQEIPLATTPEEKAQALEEDPHFHEELEEAVKEKKFRPATEKQILYFYLLARKAGIKDTRSWLDENGFPLPQRNAPRPSSPEPSTCSRIWNGPAPLRTPAGGGKPWKRPERGQGRGGSPSPLREKREMREIFPY